MVVLRGKALLPDGGRAIRFLNPSEPLRAGNVPREAM
jgi:hypothetical protein